MSKSSKRFRSLEFLSLVTRCSDGTVGPFEWAYYTGYACKPAFIAPSIVPSRSSLPGNIHSSGS